MGTLEDKREPSMEEVDLNESSVRCANSDTLPADVFDEAPDPRIQVGGLPLRHFAGPLAEALLLKRM